MPGLFPCRIYVRRIHDVEIFFGRIECRQLHGRIGILQGGERVADGGVALRRIDDRIRTCRGRAVFAFTAFDALHQVSGFFRTETDAQPLHIEHFVDIQTVHGIHRVRDGVEQRLVAFRNGDVNGFAACRGQLHRFTHKVIVQVIGDGQLFAVVFKDDIQHAIALHDVEVQTVGRFAAVLPPDIAADTAAVADHVQAGGIPTEVLKIIGSRPVHAHARLLFGTRIHRDIRRFVVVVAGRKLDARNGHLEGAVFGDRRRIIAALPERNVRFAIHASDHIQVVGCAFGIGFVCVHKRFLRGADRVVDHAVVVEIFARNARARCIHAVTVALDGEGLDDAFNVRRKRIRLLLFLAGHGALQRAVDRIAAQVFVQRLCFGRFERGADDHVVDVDFHVFGIDGIHKHAETAFAARHCRRHEYRERVFIRSAEVCRRKPIGRILISEPAVGVEQDAVRLVHDNGDIPPGALIPFGKFIGIRPFRHVVHVAGDRVMAGIRFVELGELLVALALARFCVRFFRICAAPDDRCGIGIQVALAAADVAPRDSGIAVADYIHEVERKRAVRFAGRSGIQPGVIRPEGNGKAFACRRDLLGCQFPEAQSAQAHRKRAARLVQRIRIGVFDDRGIAFAVLAEIFSVVRGQRRTRIRVDGFGGSLAVFTFKGIHCL